MNGVGIMKVRDLWLNAKLGEITKEIKPGYPSGEHNSVGNGKLHFRPYNISNEGEVNLTQTKFVPLKNEDYYLKSQDIIFNNTNSPELLGKTCIINKDTDWVYSNHMTRIRLKPSFDPRFYAKYLHYLKYKGFYKTNCSNHVNQASIASGFLNRNLEVPICPLPEQRAIVSKIEQLFSELDNGIANLKLAQEQLKVYRQAVLKKAFDGELTKKWREQQTDLPDAGDLLEQIRKEKEEAAKVFGKKLKQVKPFTEDELEDLNRLPKEWNWVKIGDLTFGVEYGTSAKSKESGDVAVLRMGNIQNGRFDWSDLVYTSDKTEIEKYLLRKDDVLFNRTNSPELVGKTAIYKGEKPAIFAGYLIRINQLPELVVADYLNYFLNCHIAKVHGNSVKTDGVNQSNINGEKLGNYPFPLCSLPEQQVIVQEIETRLSVCDKIEQDIKDNLEKAEALRQSILKKAFEGKLLNERELAEVRGAEDWEPAEVLLERIKAEKAGNGKK